MKKLIRIISTLLAFIIVGCQEPDRSAGTIMLRPHEELPEGINAKDYECIFLAGTIDMGNSIDWQQYVYEYFLQKGGKYLLYNPRQTDWDSTREGEMDYQVNWELEHLEKADKIIMYIIGTSKSPISLLEMGLHMKSGRMVVVCEPDYYRYDNVRITCDYYNVKLYQSLDEALGTLTY